MPHRVGHDWSDLAAAAALHMKAWREAAAIGKKKMEQRHQWFKFQVSNTWKTQPSEVKESKTDYLWKEMKRDN